MSNVTFDQIAEKIGTVGGKVTQARQLVDDLEISDGRPELIPIVEEAEHLHDVAASLAESCQKIFAQRWLDDASDLLDRAQAKANEVINELTDED